MAEDVRRALLSAAVVKRGEDRGRDTASVCEREEKRLG